MQYPWIIGNWKQNPATLQEATELALNIRKEVATLEDTLGKNCHIILAPSTLHLVSVADAVNGAGMLVGCQDISGDNATVGAFTGDCSAQQMSEIGVSWSLIGHSERRQYHGEDSEVLAKKINCAFQQGLGVVFCIGESLQDYEADNTLRVLTEQLASVLENVDDLSSNQDKLIIAYEPVWAIGTGKVPTIEEVEQVHQSIHQYLLSLDQSLTTTPILYGGSVNPENASVFAGSDWVHGALIGGASLVAEKFIGIAEAFVQNVQKTD